MRHIIAAILLAVSLATTARAYTDGGAPLNLQIPALGDSGNSWAESFRYNFMKLSTGSAATSSTSWPTFGRITVTTITAVNATGIHFSSGPVNMVGGGGLTLTYGVSAATGSFSGSVTASSVTASGAGFNGPGTALTGTASALNIGGNAATVTTNANLTGGVTSVGNAATVVTNANLTGGVTSVGNATTIIGPVPTAAVDSSTITTALASKANLAGATFTGASGITNAAFTATGASGNIISAASVTASGLFGNGSALTNLTGANVTGTVPLATSLNANGGNCAASSYPLGVDALGAVESCGTSISGNSATVTTNANLTGAVTSVGNATTIVGPVPASGVDLSTVTAALALKANLAGATFTGASGVTNVAFTATGANGNIIGVASGTFSGVFGNGSALTNLTGANVTGTVPLATSLNANGANCAANSFPLGVDALGAAETCTSSISGNAATVTTNANLTGGVTSVGNAATVITNANMTGDVTSVGNATTIGALKVVTGMINTGAVDTDKLGSQSVTPSKLANTAVTAGAYTLSSITVDAQGRITSASSGSPGAVVYLSSASGLIRTNTSTTALPVILGVAGSTLTLVTTASGSIRMEFEGVTSNNTAGSGCRTSPYINGAYPTGSGIDATNPLRVIGTNDGGINNLFPFFVSFDTAVLGAGTHTFSWLLGAAVGGNCNANCTNGSATCQVRVRERHDD